MRLSYGTKPSLIGECSVREACISANKTMQGVQEIRRDGLKTRLSKPYPSGPGP